MYTAFDVLGASRLLLFCVHFSVLFLDIICIGIIHMHSLSRVILTKSHVRFVE